MKCMLNTGINHGGGKNCIRTTKLQNQVRKNLRSRTEALGPLTNMFERQTSNKVNIRIYLHYNLDVGSDLFYFNKSIF